MTPSPTNPRLATELSPPRSESFWLCHAHLSNSTRKADPSIITRLALLNPDGFDVCEFADAEGAQLAAVAGPLHATERQPRVGGYHAIDEHHAGFDLVDQAFAFLFVVGPGAGAQPKAAVISNANSVVQVFSTKHAGHRAEQFVAVRGRTFRNFAEHRGRVEIAGTGKRLAAREDFAARFDGSAHGPVEALHAVFGGQRTKIGFLVERIAHLER